MKKINIIQNPSLVKKELNDFLQEKENKFLKVYREIVERSFQSTLELKEVEYKGKKILLDSSIRWDNNNPYKFYITTNKDIDLKSILYQKERGTTTENPTAGIFKFLSKVKRELKEIGIKKIKIQ